MYVNINPQPHKHYIQKHTEISCPSKHNTLLPILQVVEVICLKFYYLFAGLCDATLNMFLVFSSVAFCSACYSGFLHQLVWVFGITSKVFGIASKLRCKLFVVKNPESEAITTTANKETQLRYMMTFISCNHKQIPERLILS